MMLEIKRGSLVCLWDAPQPASICSRMTLKPTGEGQAPPASDPPPPPAVQVPAPHTPCTGCNQRQQSPTAPHTRFVEIMRHGVLAGRSWRPVVPWCVRLRPQFVALPAPGRAAGCVMACGRALSCTCDLHVNQQCHPQVISEAGNVVHDDIATRQRQPAASKTASRVPKQWRDKQEGEQANPPRARCMGQQSS